MTTIVVSFAEQKVYADTQCTLSVTNLIGEVTESEKMTTKLHLSAETILTGCGSSAVCEKFRDVFPNHGNVHNYGSGSMKSQVISITSVEGGLRVREYRFKEVNNPFWRTFLLNEPSKVYQIYEYKVTIQQTGVLCYGSGGRYATGVLCYEQDVEQAIKVVSTLDEYTNNLIESEEVPK